MVDINKLETSREPFDYPNEFFNTQWKLYQKILSNNYMKHREIYGVLHKFLVSYFQKPFSLLDLGCGDASFAVQALLNTTITFYTGIDLSKSDLETGRTH
ncbi:MAG: class I SAM-dependent methyltransferase [Iphinoe sp. HA4291-MV1]|jgi:ubiquinone/menaquinone biosynthesis C-methylase UbiE|nr:class I SAM-dependent methyltransferase [Iphinoe sp. HA4291-MV1]